MIFIVAYLLITILGFSALIKGRISLNRRKQILGKPARWMGALAILTYPVAWTIGFTYVSYRLTHFPQEDLPDSAPLIVNLGAYAIVGTGIFIVTLLVKKDARVLP